MSLIANKNTFGYNSFKFYVFLSFANSLPTYSWDPVPSVPMSQLNWFITLQDTLKFIPSNVLKEE